MAPTPNLSKPARQPRLIHSANGRSSHAHQTGRLARISAYVRSISPASINLQVVVGHGPES